MNEHKHKLFMELDEVHYKYERLASLIGILQMYVAEVVEVAGEPAGNLSNALFEIEMEMDKTNERLKGMIRQEGGAAE